jgi:aminopeptidase N
MRSKRSLLGIILLVALIAGLHPVRRSEARAVAGDPDGKTRLQPQGAAGTVVECPPPPAFYPPADPDPPFDVLHYELRLEIDPGPRFLGGRAVIDGLLLHPGVDSIRLDFCGPPITAVYEGGEARGYTWEGGVIAVPLLPVRAPGDTFSIVVEYEGTISGTRGIYIPHPALPETTATFSFSEPRDARTWFPCHDVPDDKATLDLIAIVPDTLVVGSNGVLIQEQATDLGKRMFHWRETHPIATYLVSIAIAPYVILADDRLPGIPLVNYVYPADSAAGVATFEAIPEMIEFFSGLFGPYPFDKYGHAQAPFPGGMEHQSLTTIAEFAVRNGATNQWLLAHELAHQWWGNSVTLDDWRHIWLNEGFASYGDALWFEHLYGRGGLNERMGIFSNIFIFGAITRGFLYPVVNPPFDQLFGFTTYDKGAWVLHMLRGVVGDEAFFEILLQYGEAHRYGNAVTDDFIAVAESVHGESLDWFFEPWLYATGLPRFGLAITTGQLDNNQTQVQVVVRQKQQDVFYPMPVDFDFVTDEETVRTRVFIDSNPETVTVVVNGVPADTAVVLDPDKWILKTVDIESTTPIGLLALSIERIRERAVIRWSVPEEGRRGEYRVHRENAGVREPLGDRPLTGKEHYEFTDESPPPGEVVYWIEEKAPDGEVSWYGPVRLAAAPAPGLALAPNRPNPFRGSTTIGYTLPADGKVTLTVYDVSGRFVRRLVDARQAPGNYEAVWDGRDSAGRKASPGVYFVKLEAGRGSPITRRLTRIR